MLVVAVAVATLYVLLGALAITPEVAESWLGAPPDLLLEVGGLPVSAELLQGAGGIAARSGVYYAIAVLTDAGYMVSIPPTLRAPADSQAEGGLRLHGKGRHR